MKTQPKARFALFFGNRGFFPATLIARARRELAAVLEKNGHQYLALEESATRHGAVETPAEGRRYAEFLRENRGAYDGVILCLPNFGDENGAYYALREAGVPILVQACPDEMDRLAPETRRDAFCGKMSIMDVFVQAGIPFTALKPHVAALDGPEFAANLDHFDRLCRAVKAMRRMTVGAIGARTTAFKTVRIDELALQKSGIMMETFDLATVFHRMNGIDPAGADFQARAAGLRDYTRWDGVPEAAFEKLVRLGVVIDQLVAENGLDAIALRCWIEMQEQLGISPCVLVSEMNERRLAAACEVDVGNALAMHALAAASGQPATCLDWNNNYGCEADKCILFHCGPVPRSMMRGAGRVGDHAILANAVGPDRGWGCNLGRIAPGPFTYASMLTRDGSLCWYAGEAAFTGDPIPPEFFGCAGVAQFPDLQETLLRIGRAGHRHHVSVTPGRVLEPVAEALERYLGFQLDRV